MAQLTIDLSGAKGLSSHFFADQPNGSASPQLRYLANNGQTVGGTYNPFRRNGYLSPTNTGTVDVTITGNSYFAPIENTQLDPVRGEFYITHGNIIGFSASTHAIVLTNDRTIASVDKWFDLEIYQLNGVRTLFYMYKKTGTSEGRIGIKKTLDGSPAYTDLWLGTGGSVSGTFGLSTTPTKMVVADNGFMYVLDNNAVHKIDGTSATGGANGTATANVLNFPVWMAITDGLDYRGNLYMGIQAAPNALSIANFTAFCGVYVWDRSSTTFGQQDFVAIPQGRFLRKLYISPAGKLRAIITTSNGETAIVEYSGSAFTTICRLGVNSFPQYFDSAQVVDGGIWWEGYDGLMYFYGSPSYEMTEGLYNVGNFTPSGTIGGTILYASDGTDYSAGTPAGARTAPEGFYVSYRDVVGSAYYVKKWFPHANYVSTLQAIASMPQDTGNIYSPVVYLPKLSTIKSIDIMCIPQGDSASTTTTATIKFYVNQSTTPFVTKTVTRADIAKGYLSYEFNKPYCTAFQVKIEYDNTQNVGTNDFCPSLAVLDYEPTTTR